MTKVENYEVDEEPSIKIRQIQSQDKPREEKIEEMHEAIREFNEKLNTLDRDKNTVNFDVDGDFLAVVGISDLHYGNQNVDMDFVEDLIDFVEGHERAYCFLNGDIIDNWVHLSPNGGEYEQTIRPEYQREIIRQKLEPIEDKILGVTYGNHEGRSQKEGEQNPMDLMSKELDVPYLGSGGRINLVFDEELKYRLHVRHRFRYESTFNPCHACGRLIEQLDSDADIVAIGHKHDPAIEVRFKAGKQRSLMRFGSAIPSTRYSSYLGFEDSPLVAPTVVVSSKEKAHHPFIDISVVRDFIER